MVCKEKEIMKNKKALILLLVCLVVLVGAYFAVTIISEKVNYVEPETTVDTTITIYDIPTAEVAEIRVINSYGDITYYLDETGTWLARGKEEAGLAQAVLKRMAINAGGLKALERVEETKDNLSKYGLDEPQYTVTVKSTKGVEETFYIGMQNQVTTDFYIHVDGVDGIYTVGSNFPGYFNFSIGELYYFENIINTSDSGYLREMAVKYGDIDWHMVRLNYGSDYDVSGMRAWYITNVFEHEVAVDTSLLEDIQTAFLSLTLFSCETFEATQEELEKAGLTPDKRGYLYFYFEEIDVMEEITEDTYVGEVKIWLGNKMDNGGYYYVQPDGRNGIYTIEAEYIEPLLANTAEDLLQKYISVVNVSTIDSIDIKMGDISYHSEVKPEGEKDAAIYYHYHDGRRLEREAAAQFFTELIGIYAEKALLEKEEPSGKELLKITFNRNTEIIPVYEVAFYEYSVNYYKVAINGEVSYLANARDYKSIVESITSFVQNIPYAE